MGEDCGAWIPELLFDWQSPSLSSFNAAPFGTGKQNGTAAAVNPVGNSVARDATMPAYLSSGLPHSQPGHSGEPHGWFYCLPRFRQGFTTPARNFTAEEKLSASHAKGFGEEIARVEGFPQKQFLVIDQTADQTTLVYSSRFGRPVECLTLWDSKLHGSTNLNKENELSSLRRDVNHVAGLGPTLDDKVDENQGTDDDIESEMHEDTEEINALLYSDSDGYSTEDDDDDNDEVTSTGHSPSTMTTHGNQEEPGRLTAEEVASSVGETKKRKLQEGAYDGDMQFMDTASSLDGKIPFEVEDDAESRCSSVGNNSSRGSGRMGSWSGNKKMRKEKIQDVLSILQCIVPGGKGKDPVELLDEAIRCLKSLKLKAIKLGLDMPYKLEN